MDNNSQQYPDVDKRDERVEEVVDRSPVLSLPIEDSVLNAVIDKKVFEADNFYKNNLKLYDRRKVLHNFWIGKHFDETLMDMNWQIPYKDNVIWQDLETRIAIASGRMPDIIVTPPDEDPKKMDNAKSLEKGLTIKIKSDASTRLIKDGLRNLHLDFIGVIKCRWDLNKGENGDFVFERVRPSRIIIDHTATIPQDGFTADNMEMIAEWIEEPVGVIVSKFPSKRDELFKRLGIIRGTDRQMISKIKYLEVWFTWYGKDGSIYKGVCWKYNDLILDKMKNPYYDWEGYERGKEKVDFDENGLPVTTEKVYRNHFGQPRHPYIFFSHQNLGLSPMDDTTPVEQAIPIQRLVNKRGRQITEIADRAVPKLAFSGLAITKEQARRVTNDPNEVIWLENAQDLRTAMQVIPASPPPAILMQDLVSNRNQIDSKFATHGTTRGEVQAQESGISKQITREGDLTISDDLVSIVVERVVYEMANWATQMMKVMYDKEHFVRDLGEDGELVHIEMSRDMIDDGIMVNVKASTTDKQEKKNTALLLAARRSIDPYSMFQDLDVPNPKERTKRLILFLAGAQDAWMSYLKEIGVEMPQPVSPEIPAGEGGEEAGAPDQGGQQAVLDIQRIMAGEDVTPATQDITEGYISTMIDFVNSDDFSSQPPEVQQRFQSLVSRMREMAEGAGGMAQPQQPPSPEQTEVETPQM